MDRKKIGLAVAIVLIAAAILYIENTKVRPGIDNNTPSRMLGINSTGVPASNGSLYGTDTTGTAAGDMRTRLAALSLADKQAGYSPAIELAGPAGFVNASDSFRLADLIGKKVILLDFWTYSCINCIRTLPYLTSWYQRYRDQGLEIVGIHTPEFDFEKDYGNVSAAVEKFGIKYPVVLDSNYGTWSAYDNHYWPHEYLIDLAGYVVHDQIGEGNYGETEMEIQKLLAERSAIAGTEAKPMPTSTVSVPSNAVSGGISPETYFGAARNQYLGNGTPGEAGTKSFSEPQTVAPDTLYLVGTWNVAQEYVETPTSVGVGSVGSDRVDYRYRARGVYFVAGSANGSPIDIEVLRDGKPLTRTAAGTDIFYKDGRSYVRVSGNRLYRIIDDAAPDDHLLELIISSPGLRAYTFTFG